MLAHLLRATYSSGPIRLLQKETTTGELGGTKDLCFVTMSLPEPKTSANQKFIHNGVLKYAYMYIRSRPRRPSQDLISITLMNGRALLLCVVGVSGLLGRREQLCELVHEDFIMIIMTLTHECCVCVRVCSPVNDLWLVIGQGGRVLAFQEVLHVVMHFSVL